MIALMIIIFILAGLGAGFWLYYFRVKNFVILTYAGIAILLLLGEVLRQFGLFKYSPVVIFFCDIIGFIGLFSIFYLSKYSFPKKFCYSLNSLLIITVIVATIVSVTGRIPISNFIFEIGDAGAYVNSANSLAYYDRRLAQFFPMQQVLLGYFSGTLGRAYTSHGTFFISLLIPLGLFYLCKELFGDDVISLISALIAALDPVCMWFARIPYSETLMVFLGITIFYFYLKFLNEKQKSLKLIYLFLTVITFADLCLTRVTGIIWMLALSLTTIYFSLFQIRSFFSHLILFNLCYCSYFYSVWIALQEGRNYYLNWQISKYIPFLKTPLSVIIFHITWFSFVNILCLSLFRFSSSKKPQLLKDIKKHAFLMSTLFFCGAILIVPPLINHFHFNVGLYQSIQQLVAKKPSQEIYYFVYYFGPGAIILIPLGVFLWLRDYTPFKNPSFGFISFNSLLFVLLIQSRIVYNLGHDVYLYWDRYFYTQGFLPSLIAFVMPFRYYPQSRKIIKFMLTLIIFLFIIQTSLWIYQNKNRTYLDNSYKILSWLTKRIDDPSGIVFLDNKYGRPKFFPNFRRCFLLPLKESFGLKIKYNYSYKSPFARDHSLNLSEVKNVVRAGETVYIVGVFPLYMQVSENPYNLFKANTVKIDETVVQLNSKPHIKYKLFHSNMQKDILKIVLYRISYFKLFVRQFPWKKGFYNDSWTDGNGNLFNLNLNMSYLPSYLILHTYGWNPYRGNIKKLNLKVFANGKELKFVRYKDKKYYFQIPKDMKEIKEITIHSNTFIPKKLGINNDTRKLGMDIKSISFE